MTFFYNFKVFKEFENNKMSKNIYVYVSLLLFYITIIYYWGQTLL